MPCPSCVDVIVVEFGFVPEFGFVLLSLLSRVIVVLALCLASCVEVVVLERGVVYS